MNIQPLEIYGEDASFGGGLKLLNRYYDDALITVVRHNDGAPAEVYPDQNGKVSLNSQIAVGMTFSSAINLGQFLNQPGYTEDSEVAGQLVTAGVSKIYDQSPNQNSATNSDTNTQFLICDNGEIFASEYGLQLFTLDKFMTVGSVNQSFSLHLAYTPVEAFSSNQQPIIKQADDQFAFNSQNLLGLILGGNSYPIYKISTVTNQEGAGLVLIDEDYFSNYTGLGITLESETAKILTVESQSTDAAYDSTSNYVIGGANGGFYTCIIYTGNGFKSRRHRTNQIMVESIENLSSQLVKFSPESFYNHFYNASAIFATVSLAGLNSTQPKKLIRVLRSDIGNAVTSGIIPIDSTWAFRADVYADSSGRLSLASPIQNVIDNYSEESRESAATNLGEFLNASGYTNVDNLPIQAWGFTDSWYDQSVNEIKATKTRQPIIYNGAEQKFEPAVGDESIVKAMNFDYGGNFQAKFDLDTPIASPKSIIFVYANNGVTDKYSLLGGWSSGGPGYYSRYPKVNDDVQGFSMPDGIAAPITYTQYGLNTSTHIAGISLGDNPQFVVDDNDPIEFDIVPPNEYFDPIEFKNIGPMFGYIQAVIIYDEDKLNDFPEIFSVLQGFFGVEDSSLPETSVFEDIPHVYGDVTHIYSVQELSDLAFNLVRLKVDTTDFEFAINAKSTTGELYEPDIRAFSENNDARLLTLYNQVELSDDNFEANQSADLIKIYEGSTQSMVRLTPPNKVVIDPTASNQRFTKTNSISILDDSCIYLIGKYPSTDCTLIGDGTTKIEVVGSSFVVTTSAGNYSFASGRSVNDFFVFRIDRLGTSLIGQTNKDSIYEHEITSEETFVFNTLLSNGINDSTQYTGGFYGVVVFNKSKRSVGQDITTTIYEEYGLTAPEDASDTTIIIGGPPTIESTTLTEGENSSDTTFTETATNPAGLETGDMLLGIVMADSGLLGPLNLAPSGWTVLSNPRYSNQGAMHIVYKIVDGTEGATTDFELYRNSTYNSTLYYNIWLAKVSGVNTSNPIDVIGDVSTAISTNTLTISGITTTTSKTLAIAAALMDGVDANPLSTEATWTEEAVLNRPEEYTISGFAGLIASKEINSAETIPNLQVSTAEVFDGMLGIMFNINPQQ